jgi:pimeloyl-ACP methyl ester carboxylesterase
MPLVSVGDARLHYRESGTGNEPVVLVHGYHATHHAWDLLLPRLPRHVRAYAFDLHCAGESSGPDGVATVERFADEILAATAELGLDKFTLVGHSMGGAVGMQIAIRHPERLLRLVLVAPIPSSGVTGVDEGLRTQMKELRRNHDLARTMMRAFFARPVADSVVEQGLADNLTWSDAAYDQAWDSMVGFDLSDYLASIHTPTLMIVGDRDLLRLDNLKDAASIPNCGLHVFYRVGHNVPLEAPAELAAVIGDFIEHGVQPLTHITQRDKAIEEMTAG